jgi:hypothetical protein
MENRMKSNSLPPPHVPPAHFVAWLEAEPGRSAYFGKVDDGLYPPLITKMKQGRLPITFEYAVRLERAQKPSDNPLRAEDLMTYVEHRELYRYVTGRDPAPAPIVVARAPRARSDLTPATA